VPEHCGATASITGVVRAADGTPIANATLSYGQIAPPRHNAPAAMIPPVASVVSASDGSFSIQNLNAGVFLVCVSVVNSTYLDPCHWSTSAPTFTLTAGLATSNTLIQPAKGQQVQVIINDPQQNFANEGTMPNAHLRLGVRAVSGTFQSELPTSSNTPGRNYPITIPLDSPSNCFIKSGDSQRTTQPDAPDIGQTT